MSKINLKAKLLRLVWGTIPWLMVALVIAFIFTLVGKIKVNMVHLAEAKKSSMNKEIPAVRVITLALEPRRLVDKINLPAHVEPMEDLWVKAEIPGHVVSIPVKEGQMVKKGQIMVQLDKRDYQSRLERIQANYKYAKTDHKRISLLTERKITALKQLDEIEARLHDLEAQHKEAQIILERTIIRATMGGRINEIKAKVGDFLKVGEPVTQILQMEKVKVTVGVPESDVAAIIDLQEADVFLEALHNRKVKGERLFISRKPRSLARLYDLELVVLNEDGSILPGMFARVELIRSIHEDSFAIPLYAVITQGDEQYVFVEKDGKALKKPVVLGALFDWEVHIKSGLSAGDRVIVVGHRLVDEGRPVVVIKNVSNPSEILKS